MGKNRINTDHSKPMPPYGPSTNTITNKNPYLKTMCQFFVNVKIITNKYWSNCRTLFYNTVEVDWWQEVKERLLNWRHAQHHRLWLDKQMQTLHTLEQRYRSMGLHHHLAMVSFAHDQPQEKGWMDGHHAQHCILLWVADFSFVSNTSHCAAVTGNTKQ